MSGTSSQSSPAEWDEAEYEAARNPVEQRTVNAWADWFALQNVLNSYCSKGKPHLLHKYNMARAGCFYSQSELKEVYERFIVAKLTA